MSPAVPPLPEALLHAVAARSGMVALVLGAGCSLESPTDLKLSSVYSRQINAELIADGVLADGECSDPDDLSVLASLVHSKLDSQAQVVKRLPHNLLRLARPNSGYLLTAALLSEGAISCVATLNYDLALTDALRQLDVRDVNEIAGPGGLAMFGSRAVIYLHRNVNEQDYDKWILRKEALDDEWRDSWESTVANRIAASPVVVFAGLGSPAAVLTETVRRVRVEVGDAVSTYLVDPGSPGLFADALALAPENQLKLTWGQFMEALSDRVLAQIRKDLEISCSEVGEVNEWPDIDPPVGEICARFVERGLLGMGRSRGRWLASGRAYEPDRVETRPLVAELLLAIALLAVVVGAELDAGEDGLMELRRGDLPSMTVTGLSGSGWKRWSSLEGLLSGQRGDGLRRPDVVIAGGFQGAEPEALSAPVDIVAGDLSDDITQGLPPPTLVSIEMLRSDPELVRDLLR